MDGITSFSYVPIMYILGVGFFSLLVGFILICVFSFGGTRIINLRNYARSFFCWLIIAIVLTGLMFLMGGTALVQEYLRSLTARV